MRERYEMIVVGGGFAGTAAAIAAARQGKDVLLIEKYNCLGGAAAYGLVSNFAPFWTYNPGRTQKNFLSRGLFEEILGEMTVAGGTSQDNARIFSEEILKVVLNRMCVDSGVTLLFDALVTGVRMQEGRVRGVTASHVGGKSYFEADFFIDATGDGTLAFLGDYPFRKGRETDGLCQPMTLTFRLGNVDRDMYEATKKQIGSRFAEYRRAGKPVTPAEELLIYRTISRQIMTFDATSLVRLDSTSPEDLTRAEIEGREQVMQIYAFLKENFDAFRHSVLLSTGIQIGVRESRRIIGEKTLTREDLERFAKPEDGIAACNCDVEIRNPEGGATTRCVFPDGQYYTIPYGCLVPLGSQNLLVTGRCISATHEAQASIRTMPTCCTLGEAAGLAGAVALCDGVDAKDVNVEKLRYFLEVGGGVI